MNRGLCSACTVGQRVRRTPLRPAGISSITQRPDMTETQPQGDHRGWVTQHHGDTQTNRSRKCARTPSLTPTAGDRTSPSRQPDSASGTKWGRQATSAVDLWGRCCQLAESAFGSPPTSPRDGSLPLVTRNLDPARLRRSGRAHYPTVVGGAASTSDVYAAGCECV